MKSTLITVLIMGGIWLIVQGTYGYIKGKIDLRHQSYVYEELKEQGVDVKAEEKKFNRMISDSTIMLVTGGLLIFTIIYILNRPGKKEEVHNNYKS
ncbi:MAG: hypothetical protein JNK27_00745 [Chitinophagaceae bacterium]|nr:hypothetical protein [Chitinophagaceae bacterium]